MIVKLEYLGFKSTKNYDDVGYDFMNNLGFFYYKKNWPDTINIEFFTNNILPLYLANQRKSIIGKNSIIIKYLDLLLVSSYSKFFLCFKNNII